MEMSASGFNSPVEVLAFDYFTQGFHTIVNNLLAWIAVITAAVSFWRIVASSSPSSERRQRSCSDGTSKSPSPLIKESPVVEAAATEDSSTSEIERLLFSSASYCVMDTEYGTKGKFAAYYEEDELGKSDDGGEDEGCDGEVSTATAERKELEVWCEDWELRKALRMGDLGWYRWQDLGVLDGSVVRLWESHRRRTAVPLAAAGFGRRRS